jgi:drug/metabolite transporter (DMT)-like permease
VYNQLIFAVMESSIDVGTFSLLKSTTPALVSTLSWLLLGQPLSWPQTLCMLIQCFGIIPVVVSSSSSSSAGSSSSQDGTSTITTTTTGGVQWQFEPADVLLMLFCCVMASFSTVFNAVVIQSETNVSIHVQNIILYAYGVIINLILYFIMASSSAATSVPEDDNEDNNNNYHHSLSFWHGFGQVRVLFLLVLNSLVGLAITMIYKYGDAVLKTLTQPCASAILVFFSYALLGQSLDIVQAAGAGVVIVVTFLYLHLPNHHHNNNNNNSNNSGSKNRPAHYSKLSPNDEEEEDDDDHNTPVSPDDHSSSLARRKEKQQQQWNLVRAILTCSVIGLTYLSGAHTIMPSLQLQDQYQPFSRQMKTSSSPRSPPPQVLPIILIIQALRLDDTSTNDDTTITTEMRLRENQAKVDLLEHYRPYFADVYYESPQYVGRNDIAVACREPAFDKLLRAKCWTCSSLAPVAAYGMEEHRFACAAELMAFIEATAAAATITTTTSTNATAATSTTSRSTTTSNNSPKGYLVIQADFYLAPTFIHEAAKVLHEHPLSFWTAGGGAYNDGMADTANNRAAAWYPLQYTRGPSPREGWKWWQVYGPRLDAARAYVADHFPDLLVLDDVVEDDIHHHPDHLNNNDNNDDNNNKLAPMYHYNHSQWVDLYYVPLALANRFSVLARILKHYHIVNEIAVFEALYLAGAHGRADGEYNFHCAGYCCTDITAEQLRSVTFLNEFPCGHHIALQDAESRAALTDAWQQVLMTTRKIEPGEEEEKQQHLVGGGGDAAVRKKKRQQLRFV